MTRDGRTDSADTERWQLTEESLHHLLTQLAPDRRLAAAAYRRIHHRLCRFFEWKGCGDIAEELADRTLDRVARKLADGLEIRADDPYTYIVRVAGLIARESYRSRRPQTTLDPERQQDPRPPLDEGPAEDPRLDLLDRCMEKLSRENRDLVTRYYGGNGPQRIEVRKSLARRLGIERNALRIRAHRIRRGLERCIQSLEEVLRKSRSESS